MISYEQELLRAKKYGQEHIFSFWNELEPKEQQSLLLQASHIDYQGVNELFLNKDNHQEIDPLLIQPPFIVEKQDAYKHISVGEALFSSSRVALFTVAGGQGSRLGFDGPKGCFQATPVTKKSLFQVFAENIIAAENKYDTSLLWCIMTSSANRGQTETFFENNDFFGLSKDQVIFFNQGMLPSVDTKGKLFIVS